MLRIGDHIYPLVGLDTNVISTLVLNRGEIRRGYFNLFSDHVPCFSPYSTFELRQSTEVYDAFLEYYDVMPCMMLKNEEQLFEDERSAYPAGTEVNPTVYGFSVLNRQRGTDLRSVLAESFANPDTVAREMKWPDLKEELLSEWLALKPNFSPRCENYTPADGVRFVDEATWQHVGFRAPEWYSDLMQSGQALESNAFPSVRMILWTIFFRLYWANQRAGEVQDVFDALISAPAPYLDAIVTENFQADIYSKVQSLEPELMRASIYTLSNLQDSEGHG